VETGSALARAYYEEVVQPLLHARWPALPHAAARLGSGSDVLGLDDAISRDHDWGLRLTLLVPPGQVEAVDTALQRELPESFRGWPTRFGTTWKPHHHHQVDVATAEQFAESRLGIPVVRDWDAIDWLGLTGQSVLEVAAGPVFADTLGTLSQIRRRLSWYPTDVWRYVVAADWQRLAQELPFVGRTGSRGDDHGSRLLTARLVDVAMHLGFLVQRRWPPYPKWFGSTFEELPLAAAMSPVCGRALAAATWQERQSALVRVLEILHGAQVGSGLPTGSSVVQPFFDRPFASVRSSVTELLLADITDPLVRGLPPGVGSVEQWVNNVDVLSHPDRRVALTAAWRTTIQW
jgi:hypothetical protein